MVYMNEYNILKTGVLFVSNNKLASFILDGFSFDISVFNSLKSEMTIDLDKDKLVVKIYSPYNKTSFCATPLYLFKGNGHEYYISYIVSYKSDGIYHLNFNILRK